MNMANEIIGREEEIKLLEECYQSGKAELVAVYGRRRVGKTYLVKNLFQANTDHHWSGAALAILPAFPFTSTFPASRLLLALIAGGVAYAASDQTDTESGVPKTWVSARAMKVRPMSGLTRKP